MAISVTNYSLIGVLLVINYNTLMFLLTYKRICMGMHEI